MSSQGREQTAERPSFFGNPAFDHAAAGIGAGAVATVCMNPLDLVKTRFQVATSPVFRPTFSSSAAPANPAAASVTTGPLSVGSRIGGVGGQIYLSLKDIVRRDGWLGLYRGLSANVVGNSASWGLYFLWYVMLKKHMAERNGGDGSMAKLSAGQHLLASAESGAITAIMTNPIWVVKTRMFTTGRQDVAYRGLWHGLTQIWRTEGIRGLYKGTVLALVGVSNGAIQFMCYEELKKWRNTVARRRLERRGGGGWAGQPTISGGEIKLPNAEYVIMSGAAKIAAIFLTYPYQVIRSRIQNHATSHIYTSIPVCIRLTYTQEGLSAFYKGLAANAIRILPGTCVTFVVYENLSWFFRTRAEKRARRLMSGEGGVEKEATGSVGVLVASENVP